jgi:excisionase family DNA binding protein
MSKRTRQETSSAGAPKATGQAEEPRHGGRIEIFIDGIRVDVSPELEAAVHRAYKGLCEAQPTEMTTTQAADFLDVSRPFVIKLIRRGELSCRMVGKHRRIPTDELMRYREQMFQRAKEAAKELTQLSQDLGLYEVEGRPPEKR